jgi:hypothetical protein
MELKILSGNNLSESSSKVEEDDFINEELEKYNLVTKYVGKKENKIHVYAGR